MKINQKLISGFFVSSLLILSVSYMSITLQERLTKDFQEIAGEVLPGNIALAKMDAELYHSLTSATEYAATGDMEVKKEVESLIADLRKYLTIHKLLHTGHDALEHMEVIEEKIDTFINFITEYILLKDKGGTEKELNSVKKKINRTVDDFRSSLEPFINQHVEESRRKVETARRNIAHSRNVILGFSAIIIIVSVLLGFFMSRLISRPILKLTEAATQIGKGNLNTRIEIESKDEIGGLADSFNKMVKDLQMVTVSRDRFAQEVDERKQVEEEKDKIQTQLLQAQKMEAVGTLAGGISHDFNNNLQAISGYVQLLLMNKEEKDPDIRYLHQIERSAQRAAELTKQLLIFSRKVESNLRPVNLNQEVTQVHKLLERTIPKMIDIELHLAEDLKIFNGDPLQLEQIMMNLGVNAKDAMPDGGKLVFETQNVVLDEAYCKTHAEVMPGEYVRLAVSDTGYGMNKKVLERIFEPFYTTKEISKGTGLGLAMVYGIIKSHGGHIIAYSEPGQGTVFKIYFPVINMVEPEQDAEVGKGLEIHGGNETILLVDDETTILEMAEEMLKQYGYTTITVENGERAVEIYSMKKDRIDLVILDMGMPGMGGQKCLTKLMRIDPQVKVLIASGYTGSDKITEALNSGAAGFISKPYYLRGILGKIREILG